MFDYVRVDINLCGKVQHKFSIFFKIELILA